MATLNYQLGMGRWTLPAIEPSTANLPSGCGRFATLTESGGHVSDNPAAQKTVQSGRALEARLRPSYPTGFWLFTKNQ